MADNRVGIELDGSRATLVEVVGGQAVQVRSYLGTDSTDALRQAVASLPSGKNAPKLRLSLVSSSINMVQLDVSASMLSNRTAFADEAYKKMPRIQRETTTLSGLFFDLDSSVEAISTGVAVATPADPVDDAYKVLPGRLDVEVVPSPFTFVGLSGLHLVIRYSNADLVLVIDGKPLAYRRLPGGGFEDLARTLGGDNGMTRVEAAASGVLDDRIAGEELSRYLRKIAEETARTAAYWRKNGFEVPATVHPSGVGGRIVELVDHLGDAGFSVHAHDDLVKALAFIPLGQRELTQGAFLAGRSAGEGAPYASFPSAVQIERARTRQAATRRSRRLGLIIAAVILPVAAYLIPTSVGAAQRLVSEAALDDSQSRFDAVADDYRDLQRLEGLEGSYGDLASNDPVWNNVLTQGLQTARENGVTVTSFSASNDGSVISVTAAGEAADPAVDYSPMTNWLNALKAPDAFIPAEGVVTTGFAHSDADGTSSFQIRYSVEVSDVIEDRELGGQE